MVFGMRAIDFVVDASPYLPATCSAMGVAWSRKPRVPGAARSRRCSGRPREQLSSLVFVLLALADPRRVLVVALPRPRPGLLRPRAVFLLASGLPLAALTFLALRFANTLTLGTLLTLLTLSTLLTLPILLSLARHAPLHR
jgi:hypothetical protein